MVIQMRCNNRNKKRTFVFFLFFRDHEYMHEPFLFSEEDAFDGQQIDMILEILFLALCVFDEKKIKSEKI